MSCCVAGGDFARALTGADNGSDEVLLAARDLGNGLHQNDLSVPAIHCGACVQKIEQNLLTLPGIAFARANLSTRRVSVRWRGETPPPFIDTLRAIGYEAHLEDPAAGTDGTLRGLIRALAVAGFGSMNIMMLSLGVWSGADAEARGLFHWLSAVVALPCLIYSGRVFFASAWNALRHGRTNMDVPISLGVLLAFGLSCYETVVNGEHAYFDAAISLLFFLLIGRTLEHVMREKARNAVAGLARLAARGALVLLSDGSREYRPVGEILPGMRLLLAAGERVPVDARVIDGHSDLDCALVSGESRPRAVVPGDMLQAGTLNLAGPLVIEAIAAAKDSFLAEMTRMMEAAEGGRAQYRRIADRAAQLYAPVIHATALLTFIGWMIVAGDFHQALTIAIAVLIITCPCALGLAVPMVQIVAARRLFEAGIMLKDGGGLERLVEVGHVVFDKTGTLTEGRPHLLGVAAIDGGALAIAAALAAHSRHPYSLALAEAGNARQLPPVVLSDLREVAGAGMEGRVEGRLYRLGRPTWAAGTDVSDANVVLATEGRAVASFTFIDAVRADAAEAIAGLKALGLTAEMISGDREETVAEVARILDLPHRSTAAPADKVARLQSLAASGCKALMVGDGLNDAPALVAAHASMAPANAADVGRNAADLVFLRGNLTAVPQAIAVARSAAALVRQNLWLAVAYNVIAVPLAILGGVTPLIAAIAMSASSIVVVANALRLGRPVAARRTVSNPPILGAEVSLGRGR